LRIEEAHFPPSLLGLARGETMETAQLSPSANPHSAFRNPKSSGVRTRGRAYATIERAFIESQSKEFLRVA
jgi:hypothetical protein